MKVFVLVFCSLILVSCSKQMRVTKKILGHWTISSSHMVKYDYDKDWECPLDYSGNIIFYEDLTGSFSSDSTELPFPENFTWQNTNNTLTIKDIGLELSYEFEIDDFTQNRMYIHSKTRQNVLTSSFDTYRIYMVLSRK